MNIELNLLPLLSGLTSLSLILLLLVYFKYRQLGSSYRELSQQHEHLELDLDDKRDQLQHLYQQQQSLSLENGRLSAHSELQQGLELELNRFRDLYRDSQQQLLLAQQQEKQMQERIDYFKQAEQQLLERFDHLANNILDKKQQQIQQQNQQGMQQILQPLQQQIEQFKNQVRHSYEQEAQQRHSLKDQIEVLQQQSQRMSDEAQSLSQALKGDNKQLGAWGELVLEQILEQSGLRRGHEYHTQLVGKNQHERIIKPDVVVNLPNQRHVIIDAKANISAYEAYFHANDKKLAEQHLNQHVNALKAHIKGLAVKDYPTLYGLNNMDYVLMFIPLEQAYIAAVQQAPKLVNEALAKNILLVGPSSLLVALRTIQNLWQSEHQHQNAAIIANRAAELFDKFVAFTEDLSAHGQQLEKAQDSYQAAMGKLSTGKGNLIRQAEQLKALQIPAMKHLNQALLDASDINGSDETKSPVENTDGEASPSVVSAIKE